MSILAPTLEARIWRRVVKGDGCWLWTGSVNRCYGRIKVAGKCVLLHRLVYELYVGQPKHNVLHTCDTPNCVRFDHLYDGTQSENNRDAWARGRRTMPDQRGEENNAAKLTWERVGEIRRSYLEDGETQREIAERFGIHQKTVSSIVRGDTWKGGS